MLFIVWRHEAWNVGFSHSSLLFLFHAFLNNSVFNMIFCGFTITFSYRFHPFISKTTCCDTSFPSVSPRSMYFHVHIVSILAAIALHQKHKPRETCASTKTFPSSSPSSSPCPVQCQPIHSNNNDKVDWTPPPHLTPPSTSRHSKSMAFSQRLVNIRKGLSANLNTCMYFVLFIYFRTWQSKEDQNLDGTNQCWHWMYSALLPFSEMKRIHQLKA